MELLKYLSDISYDLVDVPWCLSILERLKGFEESQVQEIKVWYVGGMTEKLNVQTYGVCSGKEDGIIWFDVDRGIVLL